MTDATVAKKETKHAEQRETTQTALGHTSVWLNTLDQSCWNWRYIVVHWVSRIQWMQLGGQLVNWSVLQHEIWTSAVPAFRFHSLDFVINVHNNMNWLCGVAVWVLLRADCNGSEKRSQSQWAWMMCANNRVLTIISREHVVNAVSERAIHSECVKPMVVEWTYISMDVRWLESQISAEGDREEREQCDEHDRSVKWHTTTIEECCVMMMQGWSGVESLSWIGWRSVELDWSVLTSVWVHWRKLTVLSMEAELQFPMDSSFY